MSPKKGPNPEEKVFEPRRPIAVPTLPGEPTAEDLAAEDLLLAEDLADLDKALADMGIRKPAAQAAPTRVRAKKVAQVPRKPKATKMNMPAPAPRMAQRPGAKAPRMDRKNADSSPEASETRLNWKAIFSEAKAQLLEAGIPLAGTYHKDAVVRPISHPEAAKKLMALQVPDPVAVARILLTWRPERFYNAQKVESLLKLIEEGRKASIPDVLVALAANPTEEAPLRADLTPDTVSQETRNRAVHVYDQDRSIGRYGADNPRLLKTGRNSQD